MKPVRGRSNLAGEKANPRHQPVHPALPAVLLVDDDPLVLMITKTILEKLGFDPITAPLGERAIAHLEAGMAPEVIIIDLNMPGLGGAATLPRLRTLRPCTPVILTTAWIDDHTRELVETYPHVTLLPKPFSMGVLQAHLAQIGLGESPLHGSIRPCVMST